MTDMPEPTSTSGGGIVRGGSRSPSGAANEPSLSELARVLRRRWPTGVAIAIAREPNGAFRGVAVSSLMMLSLDPPSLAIALATEGSFHEVLEVSAAFTISILDREQEFLSERFAGRAPVPDGTFTGIPFDLVSGNLPVIRRSLAWCRCEVMSQQEQGDHMLVIAAIREGDLGPDTDDPLLNFEGQYRGLEMR